MPDELIEPIKKHMERTEKRMMPLAGLLLLSSRLFASLR